MNALLKKEIRLLLPGWLAILLLEVVQPWFWTEPDDTFGVSPVIFFFGIIILAVDSFGREFSLGTFQSLLSQPVGRRQIWRTKTTVLFFGTALIFAAYFASCELRLHQGLKNPLWHVNPTIIESDFGKAMMGSSAALFIALVGGLWTSLLFRQIASAFWITFLTPAALLMVIAVLMSQFFKSASDTIVGTVLYGAAMLYIVSGFWLAHRLFQRAQDVAWTGGVITFSAWRYFEAGPQSSVSTRHRRPVIALLKKEFQLQGISLFCACTLLVLHIGVFFLRIFYATHHRNSFADGVSDFFWALWLVMPLVIGCTAVAEERKLGVAEQQFCLPVSRRAQFAIKFIPTLIFGVLLGGFMPLLLETVAAHLGAPIDFLKSDDHIIYDFGSHLFWFEISIVALSAGLSLAAFFASTLAKNSLQALSIAIVTIVGCCLLWSFIKYNASFFGILPWPSLLAILIAVPTAVVMSLWLIYRNFSYFHEGWRLWRRNILGITGALLFVFVSSAALYNRVWEFFEPAEPPHDPAVFSPTNAPKLQSYAFDSLQVRLPDGRIWFNSLGYPFFNQRSHWQQLRWLLTRPLPVSAGPQQFIAGSNWISATTMHIAFGNQVGISPKSFFGYLDTVGVQADGTLWISSEAKPVAWTGARMIRFGDETNWQQVVRCNDSLVLLKRDGTLWRWGTNHWDRSQWQTNWPTVRASKPQQIGTNSDWLEISSRWNQGLARKDDGSIWNINWDWKIERLTNFDQIVLQTFSDSGDNSLSYIGKDGTLWSSYRYFDEGKNDGEGTRRFLQVGKETNWVATAMTRNWMVALDSDGSLWQWRFTEGSPGEVIKISPTRLGIHNDWMGLTGTWDGAVALAADGSLWLWPNRELYEESTLLKLPKQPKFLGNVFSKAA